MKNYSQISPVSAMIIIESNLQNNLGPTSKYSQYLKEKKPRELKFYEPFRFATKFDYFLIAIGSLATLVMGAALPAFSYLWGRMTDSFQDKDSMVQKSKQTMLIFIYIGIGQFFAGWIMFGCWMITGQRQGIACRKAYLQSLLRQEIGWFDVSNQTELASKFSTDTFAFQGAVGENNANLIISVATLVSGFVFAMITGWLMALVLLATVPLLIFSGYFYMKSITLKDKKEQKFYAQAGGQAEQAISSVKTVKQLNGQLFEKTQYKKSLQKASSMSFKFLIYSSIGFASLNFVMLLSYSLGFWFGSKCIIGTNECPYDVSNQIYTPGDVLVIFFSVVLGGFYFTQLAPALKKVIQGRQAAARIFNIIDRIPLVTSPPNGLIIDGSQGRIRFQNVTFAYPKDPSTLILKNLTMEFHMNKTGLVGQSGCGKSTIIQLIMRFYDPDQGRITLDGYDLRSLDLVWLRQQIGYVGQQPVLFATSIKENLLFGNENATQEDIIQALKISEAYDFVQQLEEKLETYVGFGGSQLSGGQKQRIAIARAIIRKPKIILLDQATSALDRRNERLIQNTLEKITQGMTTITVAHRAKTIMNSDIIYVLDKGGILQYGKFKEISRFKNYTQELEKQHIEEPEEQKILIKKNPNKEVLKLKQQEILMTKEQKQKKYQAQLVQKYEKGLYSRIFSYSKGKIAIFVIGIITAVLNGTIFPVLSIFLSKMLASLLKIFSNHNDKDAINNINWYSLAFLFLGVGSFIFSLIQMLCIEVVGEHITKNLRVQTFLKILKMPVPWFDVPRNNAGTLAVRLSTDCKIVNTMTTTTISVLFQNISTLVSALTISFVHEWRTALVSLGLLPVMIVTGFLQMSITTGFSDKTDASYKDSSSLIMESMINIRTVSSLGYERIIGKKYNQKLQAPYKLAIKKGNAFGLSFGVMQIMIYTIFGLLFYLGSLFVRDNLSVTVQNMFVAIYAILFAGMTAGNNAHFLPDISACKISAANLFQILDSQDEEEMQKSQHSKLLMEGASGDIVIEDVDFKYDSRNEYVFKGMNLIIPNGKKVAFVGASGCGKSTIIQLLQRFYFPSKGRITINNIDIKEFEIHYLRSRFGVVSQQPVLFNATFEQNIKYNMENATMADIENAALQANATSFIIGTQQVISDLNSFSDQKLSGFSKKVGIKGYHISGGQKQRIAIARTILRNPSMLLLDEATSALDRDNQKKVQESLDKIMCGRTVINVAHRIETIKNSDQIFMFEKGMIIESGSYEYLMEKQGYFYNLERGTKFL